MSSFDLNEMWNKDCHRCSKDERQEFLENAICQAVVSTLDGKPVRCVGGWGREKIYFLIQYFKIFSTGMKNKWSGKLGYFEICCGPGRCVDRETGTEFDGTSLAIVKTPEINNILAARFIDVQPDVVAALNSRFEPMGHNGKIKAVIGDYEDGSRIAELIASLNPTGLNLVFIDPTDCSVPFSTIEQLKSRDLKFDLIINVATKTDFGRNMRLAVDNPQYEVRKKYERFLGGSHLFEDPKFVNAVHANHHDVGRRLFVGEYIEMLKKIGFAYSARKEINGYYELIFASSSEKGLAFWEKASKIDMAGQRGFTFD